MILNRSKIERERVQWRKRADTTARGAELRRGKRRERERDEASEREKEGERQRAFSKIVSYLLIPISTSLSRAILKEREGVERPARPSERENGFITLLYKW